MPRKRGRKPNMKECKIKALGEYLDGTSHTEFARSIGISQPMLSLILKGERQASLQLCNKIIQETRLEVKFIDLRPDLYDDILQIGKSIMEES
jgi:DNA-binding transcriptional regulator YdaS (Cro superfamily)